MAGRRILAPSIKVRILVPQPAPGQAVIEIPKHTFREGALQSVAEDTLREGALQSVASASKLGSPTEPYIVR